MGTSTDALLFFGYTWDDDARPFADEDEDNDDTWNAWPYRAARLRGLVNPRDSYVAPPPKQHSTNREAHEQYLANKAHYVAWCAENAERIDSYDSAVAAIRAETPAVETSTHCSDACPIPYVFTRQYTALRGEPCHITADILAVDPQWIEQLDRWFTLVGISKPHPEPRWFLASECT